MRRVREKKFLLAALTDDKRILDNAASTALNQDDLATLIHMNYKTIYLCGESFSVPVRVPTLEVLAQNFPFAKVLPLVDAQNISFANVRLPWQKTSGDAIR